MVKYSLEIDFDFVLTLKNSSKRELHARMQVPYLVELRVCELASLDKEF